MAHRLAEAGHDTSHIRQLGLAGHPDDDVMALAVADDRALVTTDTDFGTILALAGAQGPNAPSRQPRNMSDTSPQSTRMRGATVWPISGGGGWGARTCIGGHGSPPKLD